MINSGVGKSGSPIPKGIRSIPFLFFSAIICSISTKMYIGSLFILSEYSILI
ncbi:MAG: hypothetical protein R3255_01740 [Candidatus Lokiarchaeia archaeon]|nr:hypothetical protein [Candidatus Lokiarchaeia archaeon]